VLVVDLYICLYIVYLLIKMEIEKCPNCQSKNIVKFGKVPTVVEGQKQRMRCQICGSTFYQTKEAEKQ